MRWRWLLPFLLLASAAHAQTGPAPAFPHADGTDCAAGNFPRGVDEEGNAELCTAISAVGGAIIVEEGDVVKEALATGLDFLANDFDVTSSPAGEANVAMSVQTGTGPWVRQDSPAFTTHIEIPVVASSTVANTGEIDSETDYWASGFDGLVTHNGTRKEGLVTTNDSCAGNLREALICSTTGTHSYFKVGRLTANNFWTGVQCASDDSGATCKTAGTGWVIDAVGNATFDGEVFFDTWRDPGAIGGNNHLIFGDWATAFYEFRSDGSGANDGTVTLDGGISMDELPDHPPLITNNGVVWVRDDGELVYTDKAAADIVLGTAHVATAITDGIIIEADLSVSNSPTDDDLMTYNSLGTNFTWVAGKRLLGTLLESQTNNISTSHVGDDILMEKIGEEDFEFNFSNTNRINIRSNTGVNIWDFNALNFQTDGFGLHGMQAIEKGTGGNKNIGVTARAGQWYIFTETIGAVVTVVITSSVENGDYFCILDVDDGQGFTIEPHANDAIIMPNGTRLADGNIASADSVPIKMAQVCVLALDDTEIYLVHSSSGITWTDGGAP